MSTYEERQREAFTRFLTATGDEKWQIAAAAARLADENLDNRIATRTVDEQGCALDRLNATQRAEVMRRATLSADIDPADFGAAVFDEAHDVLEELDQPYWDEDHARAPKEPTLTAADISAAHQLAAHQEQEAAAAWAA